MKTLELHYPMIQFSIKHEMPFTLNEIWVESLGRHFSSCWMLPPISHCTGLNRVPLEFQFLAPRWMIGPEIRAASIYPFSWPPLQPITWSVSHYTLFLQYLSNPRYDNLHSKRSRMNERAFSPFLAAQPVMHPGHCTKTKAHGNSGMACYNFELMITICDLHSLAAWRCSMNDADPRGLYDSTAADTPSSGERRWGLLGDCCT